MTHHFPKPILPATGQITLGVFDSGLGGLSVLHALLRRFPAAHFIYYGDTAHAPYGDKDAATVRQLTHRAYEHFSARGAAAMIIACNSATSAAAESVREIATIPVLGIEPAIKTAIESGVHHRIFVLATAMTIRGEKLKRLLDRFPEHGDKFELLACPGLADLVEQTDFNATGLYLKRLLQPYTLSSGSENAFVLGCTHYSFLESQLRHLFGQDIAIYDGNQGLARHLAKQLEPMLSLPTSTFPTTPTIDFVFTSQASEKTALARKLLGSIDPDFMRPG